VWSPWLQQGAIRERTARRIPTCAECGREQPARRLRLPILREEEAATPEELPLLDEAGQVVAEAIGHSDGKEDLPARGLLGRIGARGVTASQAEPWLQRFMRAGLVRLTWRQSELRGVTVLDPAAIEELAHPGDLAARAEAIRSGLALLEGLEHPLVAEVQALLSAEAAHLSAELAKALAAVARHVALGDVLAERVFSARYLGSSKALARLRGAVEQRLGPLEGLGIREGGALTLVGGHGRLLLRDAALDLDQLRPYVGLSRDSLLGLTGIAAPLPGLVAIENLTVFEACCREEVPDLDGAMHVWTAGYPGRGARAVVEAAVRAGAPVRAWCDLDLDGIRIARMIAGWAPGCGYYRMSAAELKASVNGQHLTDRSRRAIERELQAGGSDELSATLAAALEMNRWVEQETMLGGVIEPSTKNPRG
jgi:hypothetical protein